MLFHLIYVSTAVDDLDDDGLVSLLTSSRRNNVRDHITGMLLYRGGHFMQVIEGEYLNVMSLFDRVRQDARHRNVDILRADHIEVRDFPDWTMGFECLDEFDPAALSGFTHFLEHDFRSDFFTGDEDTAHAMLAAFRDMPAVATRLPASGSSA